MDGATFYPYSRDRHLLGEILRPSNSLYWRRHSATDFFTTNDKPTKSDSASSHESTLVEAERTLGNQFHSHAKLLRRALLQVGPPGRIG